MPKIKGLFHRKFLRESGEIFGKISGKHEKTTVQEDIKTQEIRNLFRECHRKLGRIFQFLEEGNFIGQNAWRGPCVFYGLFEWKKNAGYGLCKIVREYYDFFFAEIFNNYCMSACWI